MCVSVFDCRLCVEIRMHSCACRQSGYVSDVCGDCCVFADQSVSVGGRDRQVLCVHKARRKNRASSPLRMRKHYPRIIGDQAEIGTWVVKNI